MLSKSTEYKDTNLFYLEREGLTRAWNVTRYINVKGTYENEKLNVRVQDASELEKFFSSTINCYYPVQNYLVPANGNYITDKLYTGIISVTQDKYKLAFYYDSKIKSVLPLNPYYEIRGDKNLALDLNLINRAANAKTDKECDRYIFQ